MSMLDASNFSQALQSAGEPAFPVVRPTGCTVYSGMSLRDWFAGQVVGAIVKQNSLTPNPKKVAAEAYAIADAMLQEGENQV
jgi:hypothetical protein